MLEHPSIRRYQLEQSSGDNPSGADNQQERPAARWLIQEPAAGILRDYTPSSPLEHRRDEIVRSHGRP
jgi:hypothetical protein